MSDRLEAITVQAPGFLGLNLQEPTVREEPGWALIADNCVFDDAGRIASRKGLKVVNTLDTLATDIIKVAEYRTGATTSDLISTTATKVYKGIGTTLTDISPSTTPTGGDWKFVTFDDVTTYGTGLQSAPVCIGVQAGHTPIIYDGTGTFADMASVETTVGARDGMPKNGNEVLAAFGRLWAVSADQTTVQWCTLRDCNDGAATNSFEKAGAGYLDVSGVWPSGNDYITALAAFNDKLVIFGQNNILIYANPYTPDDAANPITLDSANNMNGTISGIGCIARDSVQKVGDDIFFLSQHGLRSLKRSLVTENIPLSDISRFNRDDLMAYANSVNADKIDSVYNEEEGFYLISFSFNSGSSLDTLVYYVDTKVELEGGARRMTKWPGMPFRCMTYLNTDVMYMGSGQGFVFRYTGYQDESETTIGSFNSYNMEFISTWKDFQSTALKFPKKLKLIVNGGYSYIINFKWAFDFNQDFNSQVTSVVQNGQDPDEYNVSTSEWGGQVYAFFDQWAASTAYTLYDIVVPTTNNNYFYWCSTPGTTGGSEPTWDTSSPSGTTADGTVVWTTSAITTENTEWSGSENLASTISAHLRKNGQHIRYGWSVPIDGSEFSVQRMDIFAKIGRVNR